MRNSDKNIVAEASEHAVSKKSLCLTGFALIDLKGMEHTVHRLQYLGFLRVTN